MVDTVGGSSVGLLCFGILRIKYTRNFMDFEIEVTEMGQWRVTATLNL